MKIATNLINGKYPHHLQTEILLRFLGTQGVEELLKKYEEHKKKVKYAKDYSERDFELLEHFQTGEVTVDELQQIWNFKTTEAVYRKVGKLIAEKNKK